MHAQHLYNELITRGLALTADDDHISVSPAGLLNDDDRAAIRQNKPGLLEILANQTRSNGLDRKAVGSLARFRVGREEIGARRYTRSQGRVYERRFALDCETEMIKGHEVPRLALVSVSDGKTHYVVHPDDLGAFVRAHHDLPIVFHNAAFDFWVVHEHLVRIRQPKAAAVWMSHLQRHRLHDTMLLDMLIRLAEGTGNSPQMAPRDLGALAKQYVGIHLDKDSPYRTQFGELIGADWDTVDPGFFAYALPDAITTARAHQVLCRLALKLMEEHGFDPRVEGTFEIDPQAVRKFGLLTENVQVGAAIALAQISRTGVHTDQARLKHTAEEHARKLTKVVRTISRKYPGLFKWDAEGNIKRTAKTGVPSKSQKALDDYLLRAVEQINQKTGASIEVPRTAKGRIAKSLDTWATYLSEHPFLRTWATYENLAKLVQFLDNLRELVIRPHYRVFCRTGRTTCSSPNLQQIPRQDEFREVIVPAPGHLLLAVDYRFIELVTLAAICRCRFGFSKLGDVIREGVDPHCYTAAMLLATDYDDFMSLKKDDAGKFKQWRQMAKPVNFGVPGGMGAESLVAYSRSTYGVEMAVDEAQEFRRRLVEDVYPELDLYLADTSLETLAANLGVAFSELLLRLGTSRDEVRRTAGSIRKIAEGRPVKQDGTPYAESYVDRIWDTLNELNRDPDLGSVLSLRAGSEDLAERLFFSSVATLSGRIRGGVWYTAARNTQFQGLAADGAKLALVALIAGGYRVVGFVHDEILIELPDQGGYVPRKIVEKIVEIIRQNMAEVTYEVPVSCEYTLSTRWSKRAELIERGDRIYAWSPEQPEL